MTQALIQISKEELIMIEEGNIHRGILELGYFKSQEKINIEFCDFSLINEQMCQALKIKGGFILKKADNTLIFLT